MIPVIDKLKKKLNMEDVDIKVLIQIYLNTNSF